MTRSRALAAVWIGGFTTWWLLTPIVVLLVKGISDWLDSGNVTVTLRDYPLFVFISQGVYLKEHVILVAIAAFAATLQLMLTAPAVPPFRAAREGRSMRRSVIAAAILAGTLVTSIGFAAIEALTVLVKGSPDDPNLLVVALLMTWLLSSVAWSTVLWRAGSESNPDVVSRLVRGGFRGSALQVVLGLPLYVIVRRKESCWCSLFSFWSLCVGFASMILLCGPGAVLLVTRGQRRAWRQGACGACGHLRAPGSDRCPECGLTYSSGAG
jgi:hypothetical protein